MHSNATAHEHCDIVPDYGVFGYNAYLRTDSEILAYNPVLYSTPAFEPVRSLTEESFALKLFALREYARSQAQVVSCSPESLQAVTAENVSGDPLEIIYGSFSHSNQSTDHETAGYYEMIANFSDYLSSSPVCGADREYLNIAHRMSCPYRKAMRMFISAKFNEWKEEVDRKRAELLHKEQSSKSSDRFYAKPRPADPPSEPTPPSLITAELCAESALEKFFENDWIGATVPLAWASILSIQQEDASRMKRKPERVPIIDHAADNRDGEGELKSEHHFSLCTNETIADLRQKVAIRSATNVSCGKGDQLPHFLWTKDGFGNIYQGYRLISGEMVWQRRAICSCSAPTCARGQDEKGHTAWPKGHANGNRDDNFVHKLKIEFGTGRDYYDEVSQDDGKAGTRIASAGKIENATAHAASYTDCIATVLKDNGYPGVKLDLPQLAKLAATFDPSLVRTVMGQVNEACGTPPPHVLKQFKVKN
uniref:Uncharacterized protein n=1 Tax=Plectus sambesii TaxID=2011161 RepID=A0A914V7K7_9BILA